MAGHSAQGVVRVSRKPKTASETEIVRLITATNMSTPIGNFTQLVKDLESAGIVINADEVAIKGNKVTIYNKDGAALFAQDGKLNANLINAKKIVADGLKANTFDAGNATINNLIVTNAQVTGKITATSGSIGGFEIGDSYIGSKSYDDSSHLLIKNRQILIGSSYRWAAIGPDALTSGMKNTFAIHDEESETAIEHVGAHISVTGSNYNNNTALFVRASGSKSGNHAIYIADGDIAGLRLKAFIADKSYTISKYDGFILNTATNNNTVYTLPSASDSVGQVIFIANKYDNSCVVKGSIYNRGYVSSVTLQRYGMYIFISDGYHWIYRWFNW